MNIKKYEQRITELTERAKAGNNYTLDLDIGETAYLETLIVLIEAFKRKEFNKENLISKKKTLVEKLLLYYQHRELSDYHIEIRNKYSNVLTEAEKGNCSICKKIVRIFDGRK